MKRKEKEKVIMTMYNTLASPHLLIHEKEQQRRKENEKSKKGSAVANKHAPGRKKTNRQRQRGEGRNSISYLVSMPMSILTVCLSMAHQ